MDTTEKAVREKTLPTTAKLQTTGKKETTTKTTAIPPLVLKGTAENHQALTQELKKHLKKGYYIKYAPNSTLIYIQDKKEYNNYKRILESDDEIQFHTYTPKDEKQHAFVLRGVAGSPTTDDIKTELEEEHNLNIKAIYKMKTRKAPLYLVVVDNSITLKHLQQEVKYILNIKIQWERRRNERLITQCRRCQAWGHAASNCHRRPACMKCAGDHYTYLCEKSQDTPPKCINCQGNHTSSNAECPVYIKKIELFNSNNPNNNQQQITTFIPAPLS